MSAAEVQQLDALSELCAEAIAFRLPASMAILGVAGGNGLERIDCKLTRRIVGLDVNPHYLSAVSRRFAHLSGLELHCMDLAEQVIDLPPVELVHTALVFEHAGTGRCLDNALSLVAGNGALSIVLQLPARAGHDVGRTGFASIQRLAPHFALIDPAWLCETLAERSFKMSFESRRSLPAGKEFWMGIFVRA
jgi:hypothetical protein